MYMDSVFILIEPSVLLTEPLVYHSMTDFTQSVLFYKTNSTCKSLQNYNGFLLNINTFQTQLLSPQEIMLPLLYERQKMAQMISININQDQWMEI